MNIAEENKVLIEKMFFVDLKTPAEIAKETGIYPVYISQVINDLIKERPSFKAAPLVSMRKLEKKLFDAIEIEKNNPSPENKAITDNLKELYCKNLI